MAKYTTALNAKENLMRIGYSFIWKVVRAIYGHPYVLMGRPLRFPPVVSSFFLSSSSFFFPRLFSAVTCRFDVYHTSTHDVALVRIYNAGLRCAARCTRLQLAENTRRKNDAKIRHMRIIAQSCRAISSQLRQSTIGKKLVKQQYLINVLTIW